MSRQDLKNCQTRVDLKKMRMMDFLLILAILLGSAGWLLASRANPVGDGSGRKAVVVYQDGVVIERIAMDTDKVLPLLEGRMILEVLDNRIRIKQSDCVRQFCVHQGWVKHGGEKVICVPFKTLIEIQSSTEPAVDAVVF